MTNLINYMRNLLNKTRGFVVSYPLVTGFIVLAILVRLVFWLYTGRVWEDALITLAPARNAWLGNGLTHHLTEPHIHSFTSPISVLIPLVGEAIHQGLFLLRLVSVVAGGVTVYYAYRLGRFFNFHWAANVLILGYLATDQLQVFFGMAGMETQVATAIFLGTLYYLFKPSWKLLGLFLGLGILVRPEFIFCVGVIGFYMLLQHPKRIPLVAGIFLCVIAPWYLFAHFYYGSIIPNTIIAKSFSGHFGPFKNPLSVAWAYFKSSWQNIAPFKEWFFVSEIPLSEFLIKCAVFVVTALAILGVVRAIMVREWRVLIIAVIAGIFIGYRSVSQLSTYYMWYLPPFIAMMFFTAAYGVSEISRKNKSLAAVLALFVAFMYAVHIPFTFYVEKQVQRKIECGVRFKTGLALDSLMGDADTVVLEPLGYIGYAAFNKTTYDFPGLSSKTVVDKIKQMQDGSLIGIIPELQPSFIVLRPAELKLLQKIYPKVASNYVQVFNISDDDVNSLKKWGYSSDGNRQSDGNFTILKRVSPPTQLALPLSPPAPRMIDIYGVCQY